MEFWRLAINGQDSVTGEQPMFGVKTVMVCNGEVYNYMDLGGKIGESDCEVIQPLVLVHGMTKAMDMINGDFALVITDGTNIWAARDRVGVRPLFYTRTDREDGIAFASEMKCLLHFGTPIEHFPPGHIYDSKLDEFIPFTVKYYPGVSTYDNVRMISGSLQEKLIDAVKLRMETTERPIGFFLSGGLDSSLIAAIGASASDKPINTFSIGFETGETPDLDAAKIVAKHLGSHHTEVRFSLEEGLEALDKVIWHLETFDTTTIRASVPMYLLSKWISENTDIKVILSGEGADELFGGYLYFHNAPNASDLATETNRLLNDVYLFDVLRADRCTSAHGIELRVPFFDPDFIEYVMDGFDPSLKMVGDDKMEKKLLREAFNEDDWLPSEILWRQKNGMSDAVGYNWVDGIKAYCRRQWTTEDNLYQSIFNKYYAKHSGLVMYKWMPKWTSVKDPSARYLAAFKDGPKVVFDDELIMKVPMILAALFVSYVLWYIPRLSVDYEAYKC
jgi:asparagine synthase (glutamine-hydrolysing)